MYRTNGATGAQRARIDEADETPVVTFLLTLGVCLIALGRRLWG